MAELPPSNLSHFGHSVTTNDQDEDSLRLGCPDELGNICDLARQHPRNSCLPRQAHSATLGTRSENCPPSFCTNGEDAFACDVTNMDHSLGGLPRLPAKLNDLCMLLRRSALQRLPEDCRYVELNHFRHTALPHACKSLADGLQQPDDIHTNNSVLDSHNLSLSKTAPQAGHLTSPTPLVLSAAALYGAASGKASNPKRRRYSIIQEGGGSVRRLTGRKNRSCNAIEQLCSDRSLPL